MRLEVDALRTCPVCKTNVFADMSVCFGCMYRFPAEGEDRRQETCCEQRPQGKSECLEDEELTQRLDDMADLPFESGDGVAAMPFENSDVAAALPFDVGNATVAYDRYHFRRDDGWIVRFEMRDPSMPERTWVMKLLPNDDIAASSERIAKGEVSCVPV